MLPASDVLSGGADEGVVERRRRIYFAVMANMTALAQKY
jgi:hypothetical protein